MTIPFRLAVFSLLTSAALCSAKVIGTNPPAAPLTAERIGALPAEQQSEWREYLERSTRLRAVDQAFLAAEIKNHAVKTPGSPPKSHNAHAVPLDESQAWYGSREARRIADNIVSYQTPAGGWSKNFDPTVHPRQPGEGFSHDNLAPDLKPDDNDHSMDAHWTYIGTFDNDATITELEYLAKVAGAVDPASAPPYRAAVQRGLEYILNAQYPNGGWPQVYPLDGGYHDAITVNDDAMIHVLALVHSAATDGNDFKFVDAETRARLVRSDERGLACLLAMQITVGGHLTAWAQQHDLITLAPASARNYEMPALSSGESASIALYLMGLPNPSREVVAAVHGAAAWFKQTALYNVKFKPAPDGNGRELLSAPGAGPLWPRYAEIGTNRPLFGDRDKTIHDDVSEISKERRNGYAWFGDGPKRVLEHYSKWAKAHPLQN